MNPVSRVLRTLGIWGATPRGDQDKLRVEQALESRLRKVRFADPETDQQWRLVQAAMRSQESAPSAPVRSRLFRPAFATALAAAAILVAVLVPDWDPVPIAYQTGRGQHTTVTLADSTEISLNHTSKLTIGENSSDDSRTVMLEGEAFFRVRSPGTPFVVTTQIGTVRVLGTEFNVRYRGEQLEVAVVKGSVRVTSSSEGNDQAVVLWAGEGTRFSRGADPAEPALLRYADYPGWLHGKLFFDRATLAEVCKEIEDYFDVVVIIEIQTGDLATITGSIDATTPEAAVNTIARLTGSRYRHGQSRYTLY